jgi:hypothetical protein
MVGSRTGGNASGAGHTGKTRASWIGRWWCFRDVVRGAAVCAAAVQQHSPEDGNGWAGRKGWIYVDRTGRVLARNVAAMDNGADGFHTGLVRVTRDGKWGLATTRGRLAVPMSSTEFSIRMKASGAGRCERAAGRQATASTTGSRAGRGTGSIRRAGWCRAPC